MSISKQVLISLFVVLCLSVFLPSGGVTSTVFAQDGCKEPPCESNDPVVDPFNSRLAIQVNANTGRFNIGAFPNPTTGGATPSSWDLIYRWPNSSSTSFTTLRVDGTDTVYGSTAGVFLSRPADIDRLTNQSIWQTGDIKVTQLLQIAPNNQTGQEDTAHIAYELHNTNSTISHTVGLRVMLDTEINYNDGAPFRVPGVGIVQMEREFLGAAIPESFSVFYNITDPSHVAFSTLKSNGATAPDRLVLASWPRINSTLYDFSTNPGVSFTSDSAYAVYWYPVTLAPGESRTYATLYGLAQITADLRPPLALGIDAPATLSVEGGQYAPNPFDVVATVYNNGTSAATDVHLTLELAGAPGLSLASGTLTQSIGNLAVGQERQVAWRVRAPAQSAIATLTYAVTAESSNTSTKTVERQITLPAVSSQGVSVEILDGPGGIPVGALSLDEVTGDLTPNPVTVKVSLNDSLPAGDRTLYLSINSTDWAVPFSVVSATSLCYPTNPTPETGIYITYHTTCMLQSPNTEITVSINVLPTSAEEATLQAHAIYHMGDGLIERAEADLDVPVSVYPVIFVPGFGGTEFRNTQNNDTEHLLWLDLLGMRSLSDNFMDVLRLTKDGMNPLVNDCSDDASSPDGPYCTVQTTDVMLYVPNFPIPLYQPLVNYLTTGMANDFVGTPYVLGEVSDDGRQITHYVAGQNLWLFPTDFRKDMVTTADRLDQFINSVIDETGLPKVNLIGHSQGGLIMREYITSRSDRAAKVDRYITLSTPYLGAPFGFQGLRYGDNLDIPMLNPNETRKIVQNWPGALQSMPFNVPFFQATNRFGNSITAGYWFSWRDIDSDGIPEYWVNTRDRMMELLKNDNILDDFGDIKVAPYNDNLLTGAVLFQDRNIEAWSSSYARGVDRYVFIGTGHCTPLYFTEYGKTEDGTSRGHVIIQFDNGDGGVPYFSADMNHSLGSLMDVSDTAQIFYANGLKHGPPHLLPWEADNVPSNVEVLKSVVSILRTGIPLVDEDKISTSSKATASCTSLETLSPVDLHVIDADGQHTGPVASGDPGAELGIPDSQFHYFPNNQIAVVPDGGPYAISLDGTGDGTFGFRLRQWQDSTILRSILYSDVPVNPSTQARLSYTTGGDLPIMEVDEDGDGVYELSITPTSIEEPHPFDVIPTVTTIQTDGILGVNGWYSSDVTITLSASDDDGGVGVLKTEYSLDGGSTFQTYEGPFVLSQEGMTTVMARSTDREGNQEEPPVSTMVRIDKNAPTLTLSADPTVLWPPNHKLVAIHLIIQAHDAFDPAPIVRLVSVTSNEPDDGLGDGDTAGDIVIQPDGTILLRAERSGKGGGRGYTITYSAQDASGNVTVRSVTVVVPKNRPDAPKDK